MFLEIIHYNKDIVVALYFLEKYGKKYIEKLPFSAQDFFNQNCELQRPNYQNQINQLISLDKNKYYFPDEILNDESLVYVSSEEKFKQMLDFIEEFQPDVIGKIRIPLSCRQNLKI